MRDSPARDRTFPFAHFLCLLLVAATVPSARADGEVKPPFGLSFGQSAASVRQALDDGEARLIEEGHVDGHLTWAVTGLPQPGLDRAVLTFDGNRLASVELQYRHGEWNSTRYRSFFDRVKQSITSKFGPGELIARTQDTGSDGVLQTVIGYEWRKIRTALQLYYFSATEGDNAFFTVSIHYKAV